MLRHALRPQQRIVDEFAKIAEVSVSYDYAILSLIGNVERNNEVRSVSPLARPHSTLRSIVPQPTTHRKRIASHRTAL